TMIGEASAKDRPVNSLLEQDLEFIQGKKAVPVITAELTETLEEFIKRRIVDREFDDVERRKESNATVFKPSEAVELDHEQNSKSLAEVYEQEYQNKAQLMQGIAPTNEKKAALAKVHDNIAAISQRLHHTLDSLTSFHFKPQFKELNVKVITNASTIKMEEVLPVFANDAVQLAPEEVYKPTKGAIRGETERTDAERHQERRAKKVRQRE
ncbi:U3 small nucleolar ribonucleo protein complex, subunit Mpp10, partial [Dimargaris cristalligena]